MRNYTPDTDLLSEMDSAIEQPVEVVDNLPNIEDNIIDLPKGAGIVDYSDSKNELPAVSIEDFDELARETNGAVVTVTVPVVVKEPSRASDGGIKLSKKGKQLFTSKNVPMSGSILYDYSSKEWLQDNAASIITQIMLNKVYGHLSKQHVVPVNNALYTPEWLSKHFGHESQLDALKAELTPWDTTEISLSHREDLLCSTGEGVIYQLQTALNILNESYRSNYRTVHNKIPSDALIKSFNEPLRKLIQKYEQHEAKLAKALSDGKAAPKWKLPVLAGLTSIFVKDFSKQIQIAIKNRKTKAERLKNGLKLANASQEAIDIYINNTPEIVKSLTSASCLMDACALLLDDKERKAQKKLSESEQAFDTGLIDDDFLNS